MIQLGKGPAIEETSEMKVFSHWSWNKYRSSLYRLVWEDERVTVTVILTELTSLNRLTEKIPF